MGQKIGPSIIGVLNKGESMSEPLNFDTEDSHIDQLRPDLVSTGLAVAAGFFAGLVWIGSKLKETEIQPEAHYTAVKILHIAVEVVPHSVSAFLAATRLNRDESRKEPGCLTYEIHQSEYDRNKFVLYEIYLEPDGEDHHRRTQHYQKWRDNVGQMMLTERKRLMRMPPGYTLVV